MPALNELQNALDTATTRYETARANARTASGAEIEARNALNDAQKAFDAGVAEIRKAAPRESDWADEQRPRGEAV